MKSFIWIKILEFLKSMINIFFVGRPSLFSIVLSCRYSSRIHLKKLVFADVSAYNVAIKVFCNPDAPVSFTAFKITTNVRFPNKY